MCDKNQVPHTSIIKHKRGLRLDLKKHSGWLATVQTEAATTIIFITAHSLNFFLIKLLFLLSVKCHKILKDF